MNRYPTEFAPRSWAPKLNPWLVRLFAPIRRYKQVRETGLMQVDARGVDRLQSALHSGSRLLIAPNHSSHADPFAIYAACDVARTTCHIMAAWHVFMKFSPVMQRCLQWHGCFSVDREANDIGAFRNAMEVLRMRTEPLVIFPEGENDNKTSGAEKERLSHDLDDLFVVTQLFSYPGDYLRNQNPSIERIAETVDKLEEDVLQRHTASIRGRRKAVVEFGSPITISAAKSRSLVSELTATAHRHVQDLLDQLDCETGFYDSEKA